MAADTRSVSLFVSAITASAGRRGPAVLLGKVNIDRAYRSWKGWTIDGRGSMVSLHAFLPHGARGPRHPT